MATPVIYGRGVWKEHPKDSMRTRFPFFCISSFIPPRVQYTLCTHTMHRYLSISQTDTRPMYLQICEQIRRRIAAGDWAPGKELPSIRALAADLSVSVITVKRAYLDLENEGLI